MERYQEAFGKFKRDVDYYESHRGKLLAQYPEQWIAIRDEKVIGASASPTELRDYLKERGLPADRVLMRHMTVKDDLLVL